MGWRCASQPCKQGTPTVVDGEANSKHHGRQGLTVAQFNHASLRGRRTFAGLPDVASRSVARQRKGDNNPAPVCAMRHMGRPAMRRNNRAHDRKPQPAARTIPFVSTVLR